ncbi:MAG: hypothetical protein AAGG51_04645 [Cyanobacteria bacterium P01_G01_bin.54]
MMQPPLASTRHALCPIAHPLDRGGDRPTVRFIRDRVFFAYNRDIVWLITRQR